VIRVDDDDIILRTSLFLLCLFLCIPRGTAEFRYFCTPFFLVFVCVFLKVVSRSSCQPLFSPPIRLRAPNTGNRPLFTRQTTYSQNSQVPQGVELLDAFSRIIFCFVLRIVVSRIRNCSISNKNFAASARGTKMSHSADDLIPFPSVSRAARTPAVPPLPSI
jgi:hypothetical protein